MFNRKPAISAKQNEFQFYRPETTNRFGLPVANHPFSLDRNGKDIRDIRKEGAYQEFLNSIFQTPVGQRIPVRVQYFHTPSESILDTQQEYFIYYYGWFKRSEDGTFKVIHDNMFHENEHRSLNSDGTVEENRSIIFQPRIIPDIFLGYSDCTTYPVVAPEFGDSLPSRFVFYSRKGLKYEEYSAIFDLFKGYLRKNEHGVQLVLFSSLYSEKIEEEVKKICPDLILIDEQDFN